jgi:hypothetical protein
MTNATFNISFVPFKTEQFGLVWTSTSSDVRPTFNMVNVNNPGIDDELELVFDGVGYPVTIGYDHLYYLRLDMSALPELLNGTYDAYARHTPNGGSPVVTPTIGVTIDVPSTVPVISGLPTIARAGNTFTVTPAPVSARPLSTPTYQWYRDAVAISGETGTTYSYITATDEGKTFTCKQTETNSEGSDDATSTGIYAPLEPWVPSTAQPAIVDKGLALATHTFTSIDFTAGLGIVMVGQNVPGRTITGVTVNGNACTLVVASGATHYASMWKVTIATPGSYDVVVTGSATFGFVSILTGTAEGINAAETDTAVKDLSYGTPISTTSSITLPTDGLGLVFMYSNDRATAVWSAPATLNKNTTTGSYDATASTATLSETGTPTITSHSVNGVAMVAAAWGP